MQVDRWVSTLLLLSQHVPILQKLKKEKKEKKEINFVFLGQIDVFVFVLCNIENILSILYLI